MNDPASIPAPPAERQQSCADNAPERIGARFRTEQRERLLRELELEDPHA